MRVTERDIEILRFINDFGFCEMPHLNKRFGWRKPRNYQVVNRLLRMGFLKHERVFYGRHGIYRLSQKGARHTDLPALQRVPLGKLCA
jgi:DNA-binding MarR family transcriptional regulator